MPALINTVPVRKRADWPMIFTQTGNKTYLYSHTLLRHYTSCGKQNTTQPDRNNGFTLIEVMISIVLLSIGMISYLGMQGSSIGGNASARQISESSTWAADRIELLISEPYASIVNGTDTSANMTMAWTVTNNSPIANTKTIAITVSNASTNPPKTVTFNFIKNDAF